MCLKKRRKLTGWGPRSTGAPGGLCACPSSSSRWSGRRRSPPRKSWGGHGDWGVWGTGASLRELGQGVEKQTCQRLKAMRPRGRNVHWHQTTHLGTISHANVRQQQSFNQVWYANWQWGQDQPRLLWDCITTVLSHDLKYAVVSPMETRRCFKISNCKSNPCSKCFTISFTGKSIVVTVKASRLSLGVNLWDK